MDLYDELVALVDALEQRGSGYAICGGIAVALHGYPRFTRDIDLLIRREDLAEVLALADELGFSYPAQPMTFDAGTPAEREIQRVSKLEGGDALTLDLLLTNARLQSVWDEREIFEWNGRQIQVVSAEGLRTMKRLAGRAQDLADLEHLSVKEGAESDDD